MLLTPEKFYFKFGIRKLNQFLNPRVFTWISFKLPRNACFHYYSYDLQSVAPDPKDNLFSKVDKKVPLKFINELTEMSPGCVKKPLSLTTLLKNWMHEGKKKFMLMENFDAVVKNELIPIVYTYDTIHHLYRYGHMPLSRYHQWRDFYSTLWTNINNSIEKDKRQQYIVIEIPNNIQTVDKFKSWSMQNPSTAMLDFFQTEYEFNLLELWKFFNAISIKSRSIIKEKVNLNNLSKINLVLKYRSKWCMVNLGYLYKWTKKVKDEQDIEVPGIVQNIDREKLQKLFLAMIVRMKEREAEEASADDNNLLNELKVRRITGTYANDNKETLYDEVEEDEEDIFNEEDIPDDDYYEEEEGEREVRDYYSDEEKSRMRKLLEDNNDDSIYDIKENPVDEQTKEINSMLNKADTILGENTDSGEFSGFVPSRKRKLELEVSDKDIQDYVYKDASVKEVLEDIVNGYKNDNIITNIDYRTLMHRIKEVDDLENPYGKGKMKDFIQISQRDLELDKAKSTLPKSVNVEDESMYNSSLSSFDSTYVSRILKKDIASCVYNFQKAGIIILDYKVEDVNNISGGYEVHRLRLKPLDGEVSTISFRLPKINDKDQFVINSIPYRLRKQISDLPVVKMRKNRVALSSYYGKSFIFRSEDKVDDCYDWINRNIRLAGMREIDNDRVDVIKLADVSDNSNIKAPRIYTSLSSSIAVLELKNPAYKRLNLDFDYKNRKMKFGDKNVERLEKDGSVVCGTDSVGNFITVSKDNNFYIHKGNSSTKLGDIFSIAGLDKKKAPLDIVCLDVYKKSIPIGVVLGYFLGFKNVIKLLKVKYKEYPRNQNPKLEDDEWVLTFKDKKYVFSRNDETASMVLAGFRKFKDTIKNYNSDVFNKPDIYLNMLESRKLGPTEIRELDCLNSLFVDPITKSVLEDMGKPTTFLGLLMDATNSLKDDFYPSDLDMRQKRIRGYERFAGNVYDCLCKAYKSFKNRNVRGGSKIDMKEFAVWTSITEDGSKITVSDINPMEQLKQEETVTFSGKGGRVKESLTVNTRPYHVSHLGTISDMTLNSGDVGIVNYLCANPQFRSLRGRTDFHDIAKGSPANFLSTSSLSSVGMEHEDGKRTIFTSVQMSHVVGCKGYRQPLIRTGYESMVGHRCHEPFAITAKKPGKVISINEYGIIIEDEDGRKGYKLGTVYGSAEGTYYNHELSTTLKVGDKVQPGDAIVYNTSFFEPDWLNPRQIIWKNSFNVKTALYESNQTLEDGSAITRRVSELLETSTVKIREFVLEFKQNLRELVKVGDEVSPSTVLGIIEDELTSEYNIFDEKSIKTLQRLSNKAPKAKYKGTIDRIEMFYNGDIKDMSPTLKALANYTDDQLEKRYKAIGEQVLSGKVNEEYRVEGNALLKDTCNIKIYIKVYNKAGVGDKGAFSNQLKSTFGEIIDYEMYTEKGEPIDAVFGFRSVHNRVVLSPESIGTTNTLLDLIRKKAVEIYFGEN